MIDDSAETPEQLRQRIELEVRREIASQAPQQPQTILNDRVKIDVSGGPLWRILGTASALLAIWLLSLFVRDQGEEVLWNVSTVLAMTITGTIGLLLRRKPKRPEQLGPAGEFFETIRGKFDRLQEWIGGQWLLVVIAYSAALAIGFVVLRMLVAQSLSFLVNPYLAGGIALLVLVAVIFPDVVARLAKQVAPAKQQ